MRERTCLILGCEGLHAAQGFCNRHYKKLIRSGEIEKIPKEPPEERFLKGFTKGMDGGCWEWHRSLSPAGYGVIKIGRKVQGAHRYSYERVNGTIAPGLSIDHKCHNPACVNPDHLQAVTHSLNLQNRRGPNANSKTGARGVWWDKRKGKYVAQGRLNGKRVYVGLFKTLKEADDAVRDWRLKNYPNSLADGGVR